MTSGDHCHKPLFGKAKPNRVSQTGFPKTFPMGAAYGGNATGRFRWYSQLAIRSQLCGFGPTNQSTRALNPIFSMGS